MTSILFLTEAIYCNIFRCIYLRNEKYFVDFFLHFLNLECILKIFRKKVSLIADVFLNLENRKEVFREILKSLVSEEPLTSDMVNGPKHCWNLKDSPFTRFIHPCEEYWSWKSLSERYAKSEDCLLTHWQPMTSILFLTEGIYCKILRCIYLRNEKYFVDFFLHFLNLEWIFNSFKKNVTLIADVLLNLKTRK